MIKEIIFVKSQDYIETVHVGVFPSRGRYFRKKLKDDGNGVFRTEIDIKCKEMFTQFFINNDFSCPFTNNSDERISKNDPMKRSVHKFRTAPFCALRFENNERFIFPVHSGQWEIRVVSYYSWIRSVLLVTDRLEEIPFRLIYRHKNRKYWCATFTVDSAIRAFSLKINGKGRAFFLHRDQRMKKEPVPGNFFPFPRNNPSYSVEDRAILPYYTGYQVFPDRFFRFSSSSNDKYALQKWGGKPGPYSYFGGDIKGIISKLPYLKSLGIDFLYLNPVFHAKSSHRYDTIDYFKIDPLLGDESDLKELVERAHRLGLKIILDIPLNHCSVDFFAFKDILQNQEKSDYLDWFNIRHYPVEVASPPAYDAWHGYKELPEFNLDNQVVREYLVEAALFWHRQCGIDGWRLDSVSSMPENFIKYFVMKVREVRKNAVIIGEFWHNDAYELIHGCGIDGVTNYSFYWQVFVPLFERKSVSLSEVADSIINLSYENPVEKSLYCWNFLSNHDILRFLSGISHAGKYELAVVLMYALPGSPIIYYGEEVGLPGMNDPDNRRCMVWDSNTGENFSFFNLFKNLNNMRKNNKPLFNEANIAVPYLNQRGKILIIERFKSSRSLYFVFNFSRLPRHIHLDTVLKKSGFTDIIAGVKQEPVFNLQGFGFKILSA